MKHTIFDIESNTTIEVPFTDEEITEYNNRISEVLWTELRAERDKRLADSDVLVLPDRWDSYTKERKKQLSDYRQALRDLPDNISDPSNVVWPTQV